MINSDSVYSKGQQNKVKVHFMDGKHGKGPMWEFGSDLLKIEHVHET